MNLYEINDQLMRAFESAVDVETGEIVNEEAYEALDCLQLEFTEKAEGILLWIKNLKAESEALKKEKQAFESRQKAAESKADSLTRYIYGILNGEKFKTEHVAVSWRKSETAEYAGKLDCLPKECIRVKEPELNKTELKRLLKEGAEIPGAKLLVKNNIQIK